MITMSDFLGRGWAFPVWADRGGDVALVEGPRDIEQAIRLILETAPGERIMRPEFGCGIHDYAFAAVDSTRLTMIEDEVEDALTRWEPRIEVLAVDAAVAEAATGRMTVSIEYRVRQTNNEFNLVYPFYLEAA